MPRRHSPNRAMMARLLAIHKRLSERRAGRDKVTAISLARELEVTRKTIQRDLDHMRDDMELPIDYLRKEHSLAYTQEVSELPFIKISEGELVALVMAKAALHRYQGLPFEAQLHAALDKLEASLPSDMEVDFQEMASVVSFRQPTTPVTDMDGYETLADAAVHRNAVTFQYRKNGETGYEARKVHPYHLTAVGREWYLLAHDEKRGQMRIFRLIGMKGVKKLPQTFRMPPGFTAEKYFAGAFGLFVGDESKAVRIRFCGRSAKVVAAGQWHPSQRLEEKTEDSLVLVMTTGGFEEIARWLLSFEGEAKVLEPPELAAIVRRQCEKILSVNGPSETP